MRQLDTFKTRHLFAYDIFYAQLFDRYSDRQLREPAHPSANALIWIIWHVARVEDAGVTRFVTDEEQILTAEGWQERLNIDVSHYGYGAPRSEMLDMSESINIAAVQGYFEAVRRYTLAALEKMNQERLNEVISRQEVESVLFQEHVALPSMTSVVDIYTDWTRMEALYHFSLLHYYWHGGEVRTLESLMAYEQAMA